MGMLPESSFEEEKPKIVMGYPSPGPAYPDRHPPAYAVQYATSTFNPNHTSYPSTTPYNSNMQYNNFPPGPNPLYPHSGNEYHYEPQYNPIEKEPENNSFGRMMLILMAVLVGILCVMSLGMWFLFGTYIPEFEITSLKVSNFNTTNTTLTGEWEANIKVKNLNGELALEFDRPKGSIFYRDVMIGVSFAEAFQLEKNQKSTIKLMIDSEPTANANTTERWLLPTLTEDRANGKVIFSMRLFVQTNFTSANIVYRRETLRVACENLAIMFTPDGEGTYAPTPENSCSIRLRDSQD